jgi:hypothetical protein
MNTEQTEAACRYIYDLKKEIYPVNTIAINHSLIPAAAFRNQRLRIFPY